MDKLYRNLYLILTLSVGYIYRIKKKRSNKKYIYFLILEPYKYEMNLI